MSKILNYKMIQYSFIYTIFRTMAAAQITAAIADINMKISVLRGMNVLSASDFAKLGRLYRASMLLIEAEHCVRGADADASTVDSTTTGENETTRVDRGDSATSPVNKPTFVDGGVAFVKRIKELYSGVHIDDLISKFGNYHSKLVSRGDGCYPFPSWLVLYRYSSRMSAYIAALKAVFGDKLPNMTFHEVLGRPLRPGGMCNAMKFVMNRFEFCRFTAMQSKTGTHEFCGMHCSECTSGRNFVRTRMPPESQKRKSPHDVDEPQSEPKRVDEYKQPSEPKHIEDPPHDNTNRLQPDTKNTEVSPEIIVV